MKKLKTLLARSFTRFIDIRCLKILPINKESRRWTNKVNTENKVGICKHRFLEKISRSSFPNFPQIFWQYTQKIWSFLKNCTLSQNWKTKRGKIIQHYFLRAFLLVHRRATIFLATFFRQSIIIILFLFLPIQISQATYGEPAKKIMKWIDSQSQKFEGKMQETKTEEDCYLQTGWQLDAQKRAYLGISDFFDSVAILKKNDCVRDDVIALENKYQQLNFRLARSSLACTDSEEEKKTAAELEIFLEQIYFLQKALEKVESDKDSENIVKDWQKRFPDTDIPTKDFFDEVYTNEKICPSPQSFLSFNALLSTWRDFLKRVNNIKNLGQDISESAAYFSSGITSEAGRERMENRGEAAFEAWLERNIKEPVRAGMQIDPGFMNRTFTDYQAKEAKDKKSKNEAASKKQDTTPEAPFLRTELYKKMKEDEIVNNDTESFLAYKNSLLEWERGTNNEMTTSLELAIGDLPKETQKANETLEKFYYYLEVFCIRHGSCELP